MRTETKHKIVSRFQKYLLNPVAKLVAGFVPVWVLLETTGRRSGKKRRTVVGGTREGDVFWIVAEHGRRAGYVRNIESDPRVRIRMRGRWRTGTARVVPDDDALARVKTQNFWNRRAVRTFGTDLLTIRVDLQPR